jgi:hypothetical protein
VSSVTVATELLQRAGGGHGSGSEHGSLGFLVRSTDHQAAAAALHAAALRFIRVDEVGEELEDWSNTGETYTPNYVSDVHMSSGGPWLSIDTKGIVYPQMLRTMIRVLVEELRRRDVDAHVDAPTPGLSYDEAWQAPAPPAGAPEPDGPRAWVIRRGRKRVTTTGRSWEDDEYFCNDGTWTRDSRRALMFSDVPPRDLVQALMDDKPDTEQHRFCQIFSVYTRVDGYVRPGSKPPPELQRDD